ncbi:MAG TPA: radical SAM protein [Acidimicrobiia bacterium]|jgi:DNA repair photolyase|nr:radical SAM protein [Acidimicrobiia bacterium]
MAEFRWSQLASSQDGLFELSRRVVGRGAYEGLTFHEIEARSIISKAPASTPWFGYSINAYRGCSHACGFCFARPTHEYLGFNMGNDFDNQIVVKTNAVELVRAETEPARWRGDMIAMGTNTDPYQAAEGKYKLTKGIIEVLTERANDFSILTKSPLVLRDIDLIADASRTSKVSVSFSVATLDEDVWRRTEPGAPHPRKRLDALARLRAAGIPGGVMAAPLLPGISDGPEEVAALKRAAKESGAEWVNEVKLHLRGVRPHFMEWLAADSPHLVGRYESLYPPRLPRSRSVPRRSQQDGQLVLSVDPHEDLS